jgi:hypothetical protein
MLGWFKRKLPPLVFADNRAAFDYACEQFDNRILVEALIPALVEERGKNGAEGEKYFGSDWPGRKVAGSCGPVP